MYDQIIQNIIDLSKNIKDGFIIYVPSYKFLTNIKDIMFKLLKIDKTSKDPIFINGKKVFFDDQFGSKN